MRVFVLVHFKLAFKWVTSHDMPPFLPHWRALQKYCVASKRKAFNGDWWLPFVVRLHGTALLYTSFSSNHVRPNPCLLADINLCSDELDMHRELLGMGTNLVRNDGHRSVVRIRQPSACPNEISNSQIHFWRGFKAVLPSKARHGNELVKGKRIKAEREKCIFIYAHTHIDTDTEA